MIFLYLGQSSIPRYGLPSWQAKALMLAGIAICIAGGWILYRVLPERFQRRVALGMMSLGTLMLLSCLIRSYEIVEPSPMLDAVFIGLFVGGLLLAGIGVYLYRQCNSQ